MDSEALSAALTIKIFMRFTTPSRELVTTRAVGPSSAYARGNVSRRHRGTHSIRKATTTSVTRIWREWNRWLMAVNNRTVARNTSPAHSRQRVLSPASPVRTVP